MGIGQRVSAQLHQIQLCVVLLFVVFALFQSCCQVQTTVDMKPQSERPTFTFFSLLFMAMLFYYLVTVGWRIFSATWTSLAHIWSRGSARCNQFGAHKIYCAKKKALSCSHERELWLTFRWWSRGGRVWHKTSMLQKNKSSPHDICLCAWMFWSNDDDKPTMSVWRHPQTSAIYVH